MIKVRARYFKAASICMSNEPPRYYLCGVFIEPHPDKGATLTATDGHRLVCIYDENAQCDAAKIIGLPKGALKKEFPDGDVVIDDEGRFRHGDFVSEKSVVVDGTYPDWRQIVVGKEWPNKTIPAFNGAYWASFGKIARILGGENKPVRAIAGEHECDPALILFPDAEHAFGILMPMRATAIQPKIKWFAPPKPPAPPKKSIAAMMAEKLFGKKAA